MATKSPKTDKLAEVPKAEAQKPANVDSAKIDAKEPALISVVNGVKASRTLLGHSRLNERNTLVGLNSRLAAIIEKNHQLENDNGNLNKKIVIVEEEKKSSLIRIETTLKKECDDYQKQLADAEKANKKLVLEDSKLKSDLKEIKDKSGKKEEELKKLADRLAKLEKDNEKLGADLKKAAEDKKKLENDKKNAEDSSAKKEKEIGDLRSDLEKESLEKIDLENKLKAKASEFTVKTELIQQELRDFKSRREEEIKDLENKHQNDYEIKLQQVLEELRAEYERQLQTCKEVHHDLVSKKDADWKAQADRLKAEVEIRTKSLKEVSKKLDDVQDKLAKLEGDKTGLAKANEDLKKKMKEERVRLDAEKKKKDEETREVVEQKDKLMVEYSDLMEIKIMLDNEIATYRALLEGEETRLHLVSDENANVKEEPIIKKHTAPAAAVPTQ